RRETRPPRPQRAHSGTPVGSNCLVRHSQRSPPPTRQNHVVRPTPASAAAPSNARRRLLEAEVRVRDAAALAHFSTTWSARATSDGGIVRPRALAVLRLTTRSNLVGCSTGKSAGLAPL